MVGDHSCNLGCFVDRQVVANRHDLSRDKLILAEAGTGLAEHAAACTLNTASKLKVSWRRHS